MKHLLLLFLCCSSCLFSSPVTPGIERLVTKPHHDLLKNKRVALFTNQTGVTSKLESNISFLLKHQKKLHFDLVALFAPEHGLYGAHHASEHVSDEKWEDKIPIYSLHGKTRRPTEKMLEGIDLILVDIQDIGSRSYTYISSICYILEEAKKKNLPVVITDRPNPINGVVVDGPLLDCSFRSFLGYLEVPYCHGMTVGELALFYNKTSELGCNLKVVPMKGWKRTMNFAETGLPWVPTSPNIPEATTPLYYPVTGILGELMITSIGIGYPLPFKVVGAPWLDAEAFSRKMNEQHLPGVQFKPFYFKPFYGKYSGKECEGVLVYIDDPLKYHPVATQYALIGMLKSLYPNEFAAALKKSHHRKETFNKVNGTDLIYNTLVNNPYPAWTLREMARRDTQQFEAVRKSFLLPEYN